MAFCEAEFDLDGTEFKCPRIAGQSGFCILHDPDPEKNQEIFLNTVLSILNEASSGECDLRGTLFPSTAGLFQRTFAGKVLLQRTVFYCTAEFQNACFRQGCAFDEAQFLKVGNFARSVFGTHNNANWRTYTSFKYAVFQDGADFSNAQFHSAPPSLFDGVRFSGGNVSFEGARLGSLTFTSTHFIAETSFRDMMGSQEVCFHNCQMTALRLLDFPQSIEKHQFENVIWPRRKYFGIPGRTILYDELLDPKSQKLLNAYRHLHHYYYDKSEFLRASDFYVSFMSTKRKVEKRGWFAKGIDLFYSLLSRYGESWKRPFGALLVMWFVIPMILLLIGIRLEPSGDLVVYRLGNIGSSIDLVDDYMKTWILNVSLSTLFRSSELRPGLTSIQHAILFLETFFNALFISFLVLGIRRTFAPKKPV